MAVPVVGWALLPVTYLNTHIHELCHALSAVATGGQVARIEVFANGGGVTPVSGGWMPVVAMAGYVGSTIVGAIVTVLGRSDRGARLVLRFLSMALLVSLALWVRSDWLGIVAGAFWVAGLWGLTMLSGPNLLFAAQFIGVQLILASFQSLLVLLHVSQLGIGHSDAVLMSQAAGLPPIVWASVWAGLSACTAYVALKWAWQTPGSD